MENTSKRNYGIDLLRIVSMYMVATLHILGDGGVLQNSTDFSPAVFGVYLIHVHKSVLGTLIKDSFRWIAENSAAFLVLYVTGCALAILIVCLSVEKIRLLLFKVLKIDVGLSKLSHAVSRLFRRCLPKEQ